MPTALRPAVRFRVEFDDAAFAEDLEHVRSDTARTLAQRECKKLTADGLSPDRLKRCEAEARDGTSLPGRVKIYIPEPDDTWGMVFELRIDDAGRPFLACLAFGTRHPTGPGALSVYDVAHRRLHGEPPRRTS
jgi:hypothetical protein